MLIPQTRNDVSPVEVHSARTGRPLFRCRYPANNPIVDVNVPGLGFSGLPDGGKN
jgi:hypothetical protein